jgi:hypothetical protein
LRTRKVLLVAPSTTSLTAPPTHICLGSKNDTMELEGIVELLVMANPCRSMEDLLKSEKLLGDQVP